MKKSQEIIELFCEKKVIRGGKIVIKKRKVKIKKVSPEEKKKRSLALIKALKIGKVARERSALKKRVKSLNKRKQANL